MRGGSKGRGEKNVVAIQTILESNNDEYTITVASSDQKSIAINISYLCAWLSFNPILVVVQLIRT